MKALAGAPLVALLYLIASHNASAIEARIESFHKESQSSRQLHKRAPVVNPPEKYRSPAMFPQRSKGKSPQTGASDVDMHSLTLQETDSESAKKEKAGKKIEPRNMSAWEFQVHLNSIAHDRSLDFAGRKGKFAALKKQLQSEYSEEEKASEINKMNPKPWLDETSTGHDDEEEHEYDRPYTVTPEGYNIPPFDAKKYWHMQEAYGSDMEPKESYRGKMHQLGKASNSLKSEALNYLNPELAKGLHAFYEQRFRASLSPIIKSQFHPLPTRWRHVDLKDKRKSDLWKNMFEYKSDCIETLLKEVEEQDRPERQDHLS
ncbi:hypothetical protein CBS101457_003301 [Exobasidium rhododendri]|nr:hypothetical protein CBS101457_003301 [Exobasidium rhododendri]